MRAVFTTGFFQSIRYRYGFDDDLLHDRIETAVHFHLSDSRAKSIEQTALHSFREELHW